MSNINNSSILSHHHFTDYGFDPQIHYFQVLEQARKHRRDTIMSSSRSNIDINFNLQKPISRDDASNKINKINKTKKRWWRNALLFFKFPRPSDIAAPRHHITSISGPVYVTESMAGSPSPYLSLSRPDSGPLGNGGEIPYISLRELDVGGKSRTSAASTPIYLVT